MSEAATKALEALRDVDVYWEWTFQCSPDAPDTVQRIGIAAHCWRRVRSAIAALEDQLEKSKTYPTEEQVERVADVFIGEMSKGKTKYHAARRALAAVLPDAEGWREKLHSDLLSMTDSSNWGIDEIKGTYFQGYAAAMETLHNWLVDNWTKEQDQYLPAYVRLGNIRAERDSEIAENNNLKQDLAEEEAEHQKTREHLNRVERERDEALEELSETIKASQENWLRAKHAEQERDEARRAAIEEVAAFIEGWESLGHRDTIAKAIRALAQQGEGRSDPDEGLPTAADVRGILKPDWKPPT